MQTMHPRPARPNDCVGQDLFVVFVMVERESVSETAGTAEGFSAAQTFLS